MIIFNRNVNCLNHLMHHVIELYVDDYQKNKLSVDEYLMDNVYRQTSSKNK